MGLWASGQREDLCLLPEKLTAEFVCRTVCASALMRTHQEYVYVLCSCDDPHQ